MADDATEPNNICAACQATILPGDTVRLEHGEVFHVECPAPARPSPSSAPSNPPAPTRV
jgi:hypothetical protein